MSSQSTGSTGQDQTTSFEVVRTCIPPKKRPILPQNVHIFKSLSDKRKTGHFPKKKRGICHHKERNMPPAVLAWPAEQCDGR